MGGWYWSVTGGSLLVRVPGDDANSCKFKFPSEATYSHVSCDYFLYLSAVMIVDGICREKGGKWVSLNGNMKQMEYLSAMYDSRANRFVAG